ncbi:MAG: winged helix-turn-helix domain-containing protein, partial [Culicoidibacterales bacterium]
LIKALATRRGQILTRQQLLDLVWGYDYEGDERTVDTHIRRVRDKILSDAIKTHRGIGYSLEVKA